MSHIRRKTLHLASHPGRLLVAPLHRHYKARYHERHRYPKFIFTLDLLLAGVIAGFLITIVAFLFFDRSPARHVDFSASVAPSTIQSGSPSTLVFTWNNTSDEELRAATLEITYPDHFLLQDIVYIDRHVESGRIMLGTIAPGGMGSLKVRGVMFGDVHGDQTFTSSFEFRYGEHNRRGVKTASHTFQPTASALVIDAVVVDTLISEQRVLGTIRLTNTGPVNFGAIAITPAESVFDFEIASGAARLRNGAWVVSGLPSGKSAEFKFVGRAPETQEERQAEWSFTASFTFDESVYFQGETRHPFTLIPSPLRLELSVDTPNLTPGGTLSFLGTFQNISEETLLNLVFFLEGDSPFLARRDGETSTYDAKHDRWIARDAPDLISPGEAGSFRLSVPIRASLPQSAVTLYENLSAQVSLGAEFKIPTIDTEASVRTQRVALPITSPIRFSSFGRYSTPQGDQIGRGPLPPVVGEETKYWVFWNVDGTTNALKNVEITATLPPYARLGDKQSVSIGQVVHSDDGRVSWTIDELPTTFAPSAKTVGIAFEVVIVPSVNHVGQALTILDNIHLTAIDTFTGEIVQTYGARVTTNLPNDAMASGLSHVEAL